MIKFSRIEEVCNNATDGPWIEGVDHEHAKACGAVFAPNADRLFWATHVRDAEFVAVARTALPALVAAVHELRAAEHCPREFGEFVDEELRRAGIAVNDSEMPSRCESCYMYFTNGSEEKCRLFKNTDPYCLMFSTVDPMEYFVEDELAVLELLAAAEAKDCDSATLRRAYEYMKKSNDAVRITLHRQTSELKRRKSL